MGRDRPRARSRAQQPERSHFQAAARTFGRV